MPTSSLLCAACAVCLAVPFASAAGPAAAPFPSDDAVRAALRERIEARRAVGVVVGLVDPSGRRVIAAGLRDAGDARPLDGDALFEIGSVSKVFTALLLAEMVQRGEVKLTDPVASLLPPGTVVPRKGDRQITLGDLAAQLSGLPRLPANLAPKDATDPYVDYDAARLYAFLKDCTLTREPGASYEYSNLGAGLLGHALARRAGTTWESLVRARIAKPLGLAATTVTPGGELAARVVPGHDESLARVPAWHFDALAGAGALRSTANDMLAFVAAAAGLRETPLAPALQAMLAPRHATDIPDTEIALGWHVSKRFGRDIVWHNGGTGGFHSFVGFDPQARTGVVVLANASVPDWDEFAVRLLAGQPLAAPAAATAAGTAAGARREVALDPAVLDRYVGFYQLAPGLQFTITRTGTQLEAQLTGQGRLPVFASSETEFFYKAVDAQLTFEPGAGGPAAAVVLHQNGRDLRAPRAAGTPPAAKVRTKVALEPARLERLVGRYRLTPDFELAVTREGARLFVQATAQPRFELFAENEREFFLEVVDAQLTFELGDTGPASAAVLHQNGLDQRAPRVGP